MNARLLFALAAFAATLAAAAPAAACTLIGITPDYIARQVKAGQATWVGRVTLVVPDQNPTPNPDFMPDGKATIVAERLIRGKRRPEPIVVDYNAHPFCGYPWSPEPGDRVLVIQFQGYRQMFTEEQLGGSRYARFFRNPR